MSPVHKYYTNIAQILQDCTNKQHGTTEQHGTHWATQEQLSNKREVWNTHGSPGHGVCVHLSIYKGAGDFQGCCQSKEELCANDTSHDPNWTKIAPNDQ